MNNTTLKHIAGTLGCSISTVSRALKYHPDISIETRTKVLELANALDYEPNAFAVHLRTQDSKLIGLMVPLISNFFYESFIASIEEEGRKSGYSLMVLQTNNDPLIEAENLKLFRQNRVMGILACVCPNTSDLEQFSKLNAIKIPVIFFDKVPLQEGFNKVCMADERAGSIAAEAIVQSGRLNITGLFGDPRLLITQKRLTAFEQLIKERNPKAKLTILHATNTSDAEKIVDELFSTKTKPSVIFCMSDELLMGTMKVLQRRKIKIPTEVGVISISNGFIPNLYFPAITYVETSSHKLGKLAFTHLMACLSGSSAIQELTVDAVLMPGGSL